MIKQISILFTCISIAFGINAQSSINVLFIGNSYTAVNNLPQMTANISHNMGSNLTWSSNTPGGCTFQQHCSGASMTMITNGGWDFVVLQEQSQYPSFPQQQVEDEVFPYAAQLVNAVYTHNPCAEPMFYMTWGRKNGDAGNAASFPILGTYEGMDSMLYERYMYMAESNDASVCPVGRVWRYLRNRHPDIELYQSDESHPSVAGTYAAACSFYVMFFCGDPRLITYSPANLLPGEAATIRDAVYEVVYSQNAQWKRPLPQIDIDTVTVSDSDVTFIAHTTAADSIMWHFGDGDTEISAANPDGNQMGHHYHNSGTYSVIVVASRHCMTDTAFMVISVAATDTTPTDTTITGLMPAVIDGSQSLRVFPNPSNVKPAITYGGKTVSTADISVTTPSGRRIPFSLWNDTNMPAGIYIISFKTRGRTHTAKFIKQ